MISFDQDHHRSNYVQDVLFTDATKKSELLIITYKSEELSYNEIVIIDRN